MGDDDGLQNLTVGRISMEEAFSRQNDRILYLRSLGKPCTEAVMALMDMLAGLEDQEFYDGIPAKVRAELAKKPKEEQEALAEEYSTRGWNALPIRGLPGPGGRVIYRPTPDDLAAIYRLTLGLAHRLGLAWKQKRVAHLPGPEVAQ